MRWICYAYLISLLVSLAFPAFAQEELVRWQDLNERMQNAVQQGRIAEGAALAEEAHRLAVQTFSEHDVRTLSNVVNLAFLYQLLMRFDDAEPLYERALRVSREVLGERHRITIGILHNLAVVYRSQGRLQAAKPLFEASLKLRSEGLGERDPETLTSMDALVNIYLSLGLYGTAEPLSEKIFKLRQKMMGDRHPLTAISRGNLGMLYQRQGRYDAAEPLLRQDLMILREVLGERHPEALRSLNNLAVLYLEMDRLDAAHRLFEVCLQLNREVRGNRHPATIITLNNLASVYDKQGRDSEAEHLYREALKLSHEVFGPKHLHTITSIHNLGSFYQSQKRHGDAEPLFTQALQLSRDTLGASHHQTLISGLSLGSNLVALERRSEALQLLHEMQRHLLSWHGTEFYTTRNAEARRNIATSHRYYQDAVLSLAARLPEDPRVQSLAASTVLRFKGLQAEEEAHLARIVRSGRNTKARRLAQDIGEIRAKLARAFYGGEAGDLDAMKRALEEKELALKQESQDYHQFLRVRDANLSDLQRAIDPDEAVLEIHEYRQNDFEIGKITGEPRYLGILILHEGIVIRDLGEIIVNAPLDRRASQALQDKVFGPLAEILNGIRTLYLAPDGLLHSVPFSALRLSDDRFLVEAMDLRLIQTGRDLLRPPTDRPVAGLLALGGIDFDAPGRKQAGSATAKDPSAPSAPFLLSESQLQDLAQASFGKGFTVLPATTEEVESIAALYRAHRRDEPVEVWSGSGAEESRLKSMDTPPRVLHLATHGFYWQPTSPLDRPMLLSGITLAGANRALKNRGEDGILYAIEAQGLPLEGTELVVLSACETAQGQSAYGEGVYGLVRAFRTAGAAKVLVTLWPVDDQHASDFMQTFYRHHLNDQLDPAMALRATQLEFIGKDDELLSDPITWAPYVLIGH